MDQESKFLECDRRYKIAYTRFHDVTNGEEIFTPKRGELDPIESMRAEYTRLFADYEHKLTDQEKIIDDLKENKIADLDGYVDGLNEQIEELEKTVKSQQTRIIELESTIDALGADVSYLESQIPSAL